MFWAHRPPRAGPGMDSETKPKRESEGDQKGVRNEAKMWAKRGTAMGAKTVPEGGPNPVSVRADFVPPSN